MKTSREQFEFEMSKFGDCVDMRRAKNGDQEYMAWDVGLAWRMWQASRQCIEVDTPLLCGDGENDDSEYTQGYNAGIIATQNRIVKAGIKIKGA